MSLEKQMENYVNFCMPLMVGFYNKFLDDKFENQKVEIIPFENKPFSSLMEVCNGDFDTIYVNNKLLIQRFNKTKKMILIHEISHLIFMQLPTYQINIFPHDLKEWTRRTAVRFVNEGVAEFMAINYFNYLYGNSFNFKIKKKINHFTNNLMYKSLYNKIETPDEWIMNNVYSYGYNFFKKIDKKYGLEEVFRIVENPHKVNISNIFNPKNYQ